MKIIRNSLKCSVQKWSDPGPGMCGAGLALRDADYVEEITGTITVELTREDIGDDVDNETPPRYLADAVREYVADHGSEIEHDLPYETKVTGWRVEKVEGLTAVLSVDDFEAGEVVQERDEED